MSVRLHTGDCVEVMASMPEASVDAVVCDPPYGLEFMGKEWDSLDMGLPQEGVWKGRRGQGGASIGTDDSKPSSRHHVASGVRQHGFRRCQKCGKRQFSGTPCECLEPDWVLEYAQRAPSAAIRMQRWHERWAREAYRVLKPGGHLLAFGGSRTYHRMACAAEDAGFEIRDQIMWLYGSGFPKSHNLKGDWQGWGTALKPAHEPIVVARKPLIGTVAANVEKHGTGALNVDGCRIEGSGWVRPDGPSGAGFKTDKFMGSMGRGDPTQPGGLRESRQGRWPANVILDEAAGKMLDEQSGEREGCKPHWVEGHKDYEGWGSITKAGKHAGYTDTGGASRFFYCPKASRKEREAGVTGLLKCHDSYEGGPIISADHPNIAPGGQRSARNHHPTVKPVALMRYLVRLVTPPGGVVLDPFLGSGTTALACIEEGFDCIGIEREAEYVEIAKARIKHWQERPRQAALGLAAAA